MFVQCLKCAAHNKCATGCHAAAAAPLAIPDWALQYVHNVTKKQPTTTLAEFELMVMVAAMRLGSEEAHAVSIAADITERTGRGVRRANVYMTLQRLEEKGLLATALGESRPERGGKPRRLVTPTREGLAAVRATMAGITAMTRGVRI
jgi:DNA-binding MarR family transcriptional regulator